MTSTFYEAAENSRLRCDGLVQWRGSFALDSFAWLVPPVLNACTRIAVEMCPARSILRAVGYELAAGRDVPDPGRAGPRRNCRERGGRHRGMLPAVDDLQHRRDVMASSEKAPKVVALAA
jgi:hypothetical protein